LRIGVDFDNTIACYDGVFHVAAVERGLIPADGVAADKTSVRDHLRRQGRDADFTALQGYVYGPGMRHVRPYPGVAETLGALRGAGHDLFVVSHKTRTPFAGPAYDLHAAARDFLEGRRLVDAALGPVAPDAVFFELTKEEKVARVAALGCDVFIDDLPEILAMEGFPPGVRKLLFDPEGHHPGGVWRDARFEAFTGWDAIAAAILDRAP